MGILKTFSHGVHLRHHKKATEAAPLVSAPVPAKVILPVQQHLGAPNEPVVKVGDEVRQGQTVADTAKFVSAPVHTPIAGKVTRIEPLPTASGLAVLSVVVEAGGEAAPSDPVAGAPRSLDALAPEEIRRIVREAGIVGLGGAAFPSHVKLSPPPEKQIEAIIINGCECEPYITIDHRLMLERTGDLIFGARVVAKAVGARRIIFGIEDNKPDAIAQVQKTLAETRQEAEVVRLKTKYPQGGEKMLIRAILGREVPSGGLPMDVGAVVHNVGTTIAMAEAVRFGTPLTRRAVTVTGSGVREPKNLVVCVGTPFRDVVEACGGLTEDAAKVVMGGPMTGTAVSSLEVPVVKATSCILVLNRADAKADLRESDCIRCGRCLQACPVGLMPTFIAQHAKGKNWDRARECHVMDCIECGCCGYTCPSRIPLVQYMKLAKRTLQQRKAG